MGKGKGCGASKPAEDANKPEPVVKPTKPTEKAMAPKRAALIVIDGWGERQEEYGNCIKQASTPVMDGFKANANWAVIDASGLAVGLPEGTMGNSEVGHLTIGAGAVEWAATDRTRTRETARWGSRRSVLSWRSYQDLVKINLAMDNGSMAKVSRHTRPPQHLLPLGQPAW